MNRDMDLACQCTRVRESLLVEWLGQLRGCPGSRDKPYWLTLARITELALWCAGNYADAGLSTAAGDLLINPRRKLLYIKGQTQPVLLKRHQAITRQVTSFLPPGMGPIQWLKKRTHLVIEEEALLPTLRQDLPHWEGFSTRYLESLDRRMERIASTLGFIPTLHLPMGRSLPEHLRLVSAKECALIEENLCRFDLEMYEAWGSQLQAGN
jgi:hypothetical protein